MTKELFLVDQDGGILHLHDGTRCLIQTEEQPITIRWTPGDDIELSIAELPVFRLRSLVTEEVAHALLYDGNEQLVELPS